MVFQPEREHDITENGMSSARWSGASQMILEAHSQSQYHLMTYHHQIFLAIMSPSVCYFSAVFSGNSSRGE